ncbi:ras-related Rab-11B isoform X2, partial [Brachionus plicatilis]
KNEFQFETHPTIGIDFTTKTVELDSKCIKVQIWDTAGQDRFKSISTAFYRGSVAALLVYDITNPSTFKNLDKWLGDVKKYADPNIAMILVGNKSDLETARKVNSLTAQEFAEMNNMSFIETSALNSSNVEEAFMNVIKG